MSQEPVLNKLVELGALSNQDAQRALNSPQKPVSFLLRQKLITDTALLQVMMDLHKGNKSSKFVFATDLSPDQDALLLISGDVALRRLLLPVKIDEKNKVLDAVFSIAKGGNVDDRDLLVSRLGSGWSVNILLSSEEEIRKAISAAYRAEGELRKINDAKAKEETDRVDTAKGGTALESLTEDSAAVRFVSIVLNQAVTDGASDIHIEQTEDALLVRFRQDGILRYISEDTPKSLAPAIISRVKVLADLDIAEKRRPQDGRLTYLHEKRGRMDFRVAILPTVNGEKVIMRILDNSSASLTLKELGFSQDNLSRFESAYTKPYGMILVTGPTGSGKSTTLYATLNVINSPEKNIITVEDPVEYKIQRINQIQVNPKSGLTFAKALRSILRADPDVILVGEIRDAETAQIAVEAAQTGHLVLSTLHTNDAPSSFERLVDLGVDPFIVGNVVESVLAQRLCRKVCQNCKQPVSTSAEELLQLGDFPYNPGDPLPTIYEAKTGGCKQCGTMGYRGRMAVHEVLVKTPRLEKIISSGGKTPDVMEQGISDGMRTLRQDGWDRVLAGQTTIPEILRVVS